MKSILLTGANGFTASYVSALFRQQGYKIIPLTRTASTPDTIACDLTDCNALKASLRDLDFQGVIHLAARSFVGHGDNADFYAVNTVGTTNLLQVMDELDISPEKIIVASSANIYGNPTEPVLTEESELRPENHYAASTLAMEKLVGPWFDRFAILICRPFNYTGIGQRCSFLIPKLVAHFRDHKRVIELGNLDIARDFSDVRDIATCYLKLYESERHSEIVNLCSGTATSLAEVISMLNGLAGYDIETRVNPKFVRKHEITMLRGSNKKLREFVGFAPQIPLQQTLKEMLQA